MAVKKKNPQDATRRNIQAANKKLKALDARVDALEMRVAALDGGSAGPIYTPFGQKTKLVRVNIDEQKVTQGIE